MDMSYYQISAEELGKNSKVPLLKLGDSGEVFYELAMEMVNEIEKNNAAGRRTVFICPVGPVGQYPIFVRLVNERRLSLKNSWFINMDEYLTDDEEWIDESSPLSFHGFMNRTVYSKIDPELVMPEEQRIFPDPHDPERIAKVIDELGGVDIRTLPLAECTKRIAYVSQDNYLFDLSVMDNIRMGKKGASDEEVIDAAKKCGCHEFIMGLENGYQTVCGASGGHLSGGERQRISIARAMLKDAPIVILDEATASFFYTQLCA